MPCSRPIRVSLPCSACSISARLLTVWIMISFWDILRFHSASLDRRSRLILSYLSGRRQYVCYGGSTSTTAPVLFGVPQGSVLSPLFFVLYTADAFRIAEELDFSIHGYADDLQIYDHCFVLDTQQLNDQLVHCIDCMGPWMRRNRLKLNAAKTEFIWLGSVRRLATCSFGPIVVNGEVVQPSLTVRDLGVIIDPAISFADHVVRLARTCYFQIRQLRSIRGSLAIESCHALVRAMVLSRLDYCNGLLGGGPEVPTRPAPLCHEGCCTTYPGAPSAKSRDQRNSYEAALAWYAVASAIQALLPRVPVSTRFCSPVSGGLLHSSQLNWGTLTASIGCRRVTSRPTHLDCDNWPPGVCGFLSCRVEQSPGRVFVISSISRSSQF